MSFLVSRPNAQSGARPSGRASVPIAHTVWACAVCRTPFFIGTLAPGTAIEVVCKRHGCRLHKVPVAILVPRGQPVTGPAGAPAAEVARSGG